MTAALFLALAIVTEVGATLSLRMATTPTATSRRSRWWIVPVVVGYGIAFVGLSAALNEGMAIGVAYGIWAASGVALTAVLSRVLFQEPLTKPMMLGIGLIVVGVLMIELGTLH